MFLFFSYHMLYKFEFVNGGHIFYFWGAYKVK
jgi:hypothetical protein